MAAYESEELPTTQQKIALEADQSGAPLGGFFAAAERTNFGSHSTALPRRLATLGTKTGHSKELVKTPHDPKGESAIGGVNGTRRISCSFQYSDIKSVEAKSLERLARARVRSECALLGVKNPKVEIERGMLVDSVNNRRRFRGEIFAIIPTNLHVQIDPSAKNA